MVTVRSRRLGNKTLLYYLFGTVVLVSFGLVIAGELETLFAWWLTIVLLLPPLLWAFKTPYVALKTICGVSFITQFITLPFFYVNSDRFAWGHVKPFNFTALESFPIMAKLSLFLFALVLLFKWIYTLNIAGGPFRNLTKTNHQAAATEDRFNKNSAFDIRHNKNALLYTLLIVLLMAMLTPLNSWAYSKGINLVGVESFRLPYKLSGILHYSTRYITPLILGYLYFKSKRGWLLTLLFLAYAFWLGLCTVSKGSVMIIMLPVLALAWVDKRKIILVVAGIGTAIGVTYASGSRIYVHYVVAGRTGADTSLDIFTLMSKISNDLNLNSKIFNLEYIPNLIDGVLQRIEGFGNLVMAQYYDPDKVIGAWGFILRLIWRALAPFDRETLDLHSMQWQGYTLPQGFYSGGALLSNAVIVGNAGWLWVILSALVTAMILVILEKSSNRIGKKYEKFQILKAPVIVFLSLIFFTEAGGAIIFVFPFMFLFIISRLPTLFTKKRLKQTGFKIA